MQWVPRWNALLVRQGLRFFRWTPGTPKPALVADLSERAADFHRGIDWVNAALSPDGARIVLSDSMSLSVIDLGSHRLLKRMTARRLQQLLGDDLQGMPDWYGICWSPDAASLCFTVPDRAGGSDGSAWEIAVVAGGNRLTRLPGNLDPRAWVPRLGILCAAYRPWPSAMWAEFVDSSGRVKRRLRRSCLDVAWSGKWVVLAHREWAECYSPDMKYRICTMSLPGYVGGSALGAPQSHLIVFQNANF